MIYNSEQVLEIILEKKYNQQNPLISLSGVASKDDLLIFEKNEAILSQKDPLDYFYFLISGRASVWNQISWNENSVIEYLKPLDILGLVEYLNLSLINISEPTSLLSSSYSVFFLTTKHTTTHIT